MPRSGDILAQLLLSPVISHTLVMKGGQMLDLCLAMSH